LDVTIEDGITMKLQSLLVFVGIVIIVAVIVAYLGISGILIQEGTIPSEKPITIVSTISTNPNILPESLASPELLEQLKNLNLQYHDFAINKWGIDPNTNEIILYMNNIRNQSQIDDLQGTHICNYTIRIIHDTEFEKIRDEVYNNLTLLRKDSRYQINTINMGTNAFGISDSPRYYAEVWVNELTPENQKLDNTMIQGWRIQILKPSFDPENYKPLTISTISGMSPASTSL